MFAVNHWQRIAILILFTVVLAGCGKKDEVPKIEDNPKLADPPKVEKKNGDITTDDLRRAAKAAGGDLDTKKPEPTNAPESLAKVKPDVVITAEEWAKQSEDAGKPSAPFDKNVGKIVDLTGVVKNVGVYLALETTPDRLPLIVPTTEKEPWKKVFPGQTVRLRARINELVHWEIIDVKGAMPDKFTAEQLAREVAADKKGMESKYKDKYIIVSGIIEKAEVSEYGHAYVTLKSPSGGGVVKCFFSGSLGSEKARNKSFQPGMKLVAVGGYDGTSLGVCQAMELAP
ncbi:hypothetical protein J8F10_25890 [Gemmata sp. G18]|uniref:S1 motif domain-containing protein n=1 Tax=Gemmata palustris TaxID=2822762 RepID=A0ABS5BZ38_9BACT|nr:hypothetical protein [Gemmata palustris]MBP3958692.1 hypothetical protein [Gemmata palustris]